MIRTSCHWPAESSSCLCVVNTYASADWLHSQQQTNGSIASGLDLAAPPQNTSESARALHMLGRVSDTGPSHDVPLYLLLPARSGDITLRAPIQTSTLGDYQNYDEESLTVRVAQS